MIAFDQEIESYLQRSYFFDFDDKGIQKFVQKHTESDDSRQKAMDLYHAVRDGWRYNPYNLHVNKEAWKASEILERTDGHCLDKSILLVACLRTVGIPARLHLAKVKNHIAVERIIEKFQNDELTPHGMVDLYLDGEWLKVSPAFNSELCDKMGVDSLDFDGYHDSVFHEFSKEGSKFMEYIEDYGHFEDVPLDFIFTNMQENYPLFSKMLEVKGIISMY